MDSQVTPGAVKLREPPRQSRGVSYLSRHEQDDAYVIEATLRNFAPIPAFCVRWEYPLMLPAPELNPEHLKEHGGRGAKVPSDEEFLSLFMPEWPEDNPRFALLTNNELRMQFKARKFDKDCLAACRDELESKGKIGVVRGLPHNQILVGLPKAVKAYEANKNGGKPAANGKAKRGR